MLRSTNDLQPLRFLLVAVVYWLSLWRIIRSNRGNRVIECGGITLVLFFLMLLLMKISSLPDWVIPSLGLLLFLLCLLTVVFLVLQGVQAIRHRRSKAITPSSSVSYSATRGVDYEPRSVREKWLLQVAYWGTIFIVALVLWHYVKAR
jgi:thiol:disulfide interchange protein